MRSLVHTLCAAVILTACNGSERDRLPRSAGGQGEVLVVMGKAHWEGAPGAAVRVLLEQPVDGLPQREARFKVAHTLPSGLGSLLKTHHSVLIAQVDPDAQPEGLLLLRDQEAQGQLTVRLAAHRAEDLISLVQREGGEVLDALENHQRLRVQQRLAREKDASISSSLRAQHGLELDVPGGYTVRTQAPRFSWLQRDRLVSGSGLDHNVIEGLLIHRHAYTSDTTFQVPYLVELRDSVTKAHVPGPDPGSFMVVQRGFEQMDLMPHGRAVSLNGSFAYVMQGLFGMHGAKMGGPFVSLSLVDTARQELITVEGFVYAPQFDKREYMRELEALVRTVRISGDDIPLTTKQ